MNTIIEIAHERKEGHEMDILLHDVEVGSGEPLVLLHGNGEDGTYFKHQLTYFSKRYRVFAVDTRGHGKSLRGNQPFTMDQFAEDLHHWMEQKGLTSAIFLGFSDGANLAMKFVLRYPGQVKALILNGGNYDAKGVKRSVQWPIEIGYHLCHYFARYSVKAYQKMEMLGLMVNEPQLTLAQLATIEVPVLVIAGTRDMIKSSHTKKMAQIFKHSKLVFLHGDHFIAAKEPEAFNHAVDEFLTEVSPLSHV